MATRTKRRTTAVAASVLAVAALAAMGCDGEYVPGQSQADTQQRSRPPAAGPARALPRDVAVIRAWSEALRDGRVDAAARYFARPAVVENGSAPLSLETPTALRIFNRSLPCGAKLLETRRAGRYTVATFRLTERAGGDCGTGAGHKAATAFTFRAGKIAEWRRVAVPGQSTPEPEPDAPPPQES